MMEQLYNDFVTKVLPKIQEGLIITKDYFMDLATRYVKYLIVMDSIYLLFSITGLSISLYYSLRKKTIDWIKAGADSYGNERLFILFLIVPVCFGFLISTFVYAENLAKDLFIPEIRIIEELKPLLK